MKPAMTAVQILEDQKRRLAGLQERKTRAEVKLETERAALAAASEEAMTLFGTSNLDDLRQIYKDRGAENDQKVMDFMMALDAVDQQLSDIERQVKL